MKDSRFLRVALGCLVAAAFIGPLSAQKFETYPYAGYFFPDTFSLGTTYQGLKDEGIYGVKGGFFLTRKIEVEGNFGYINHFELEGSDPESRGILWEASVDAIHQRCLEQGLDITWPPTDMPWNVREMHVRHPDGHVFRISQGLEQE